MRLFLIVNGADVRVPSAEQGDEFVRAVAQGHLGLDAISQPLRDWAP